MPACLLLVALIPRQSIKQRSLESAQYLCEGDQFAYMEEGVEGSCIDRYADSILLNIAYNLDSDNPLRSVMVTAYYFTPDHEENENYLTAVSDDPGINRQYLRYWHGSIVFIRPLLTVMNIKGIYTLNAALLVILFAAFACMCVKSREYHLLTAFTLALVICRAWYAPMCFEYTWMFMLMLAGAVIAFTLSRKHMEEYYPVFFVIIGMCTSFLDFLTTETLTLLMPLLVIIWLSRRQPDKASGLTNPLKYASLWFAGYAGMWGAKWLLCSIVMRENALPYVTGHVSERLAGDYGIDSAHPVAGAIARNISCLFPLGYGAWSVAVFIAMIIAAAYVGFVYHRGSADMKTILVMTAIALVPYVRYIVLHNHSYLHCFFTYRAQAATVAAIVLIIAYITEKDNGR